MSRRLPTIAEEDRERERARKDRIEREKFTPREQANIWRAVQFLIMVRKTIGKKMGTGELVQWRNKVKVAIADLPVDELDETAKRLRP